MNNIYSILSMDESGMKQHELKFYFHNFFDSLFDTFNQSVFNISLIDMAKFDPDLPIAFCNHRWNNDIIIYFEDTIRDLRKAFDIDIPFMVNYLPYDIMECKHIKDISIQNEDNIYRFQGFVDAISGIYSEVKYIYKCTKCKNWEISFKKKQRCYYCNCSTLDSTQTKKTLREFELKEAYDYQTISESVMAKVELSENYDANIFDIQSMLNKKLDFLAKLKFIEVGKKYMPKLEIIGIRDAKLLKLSDERKKEVDDFIKEKKHELLPIISEHIFFGHKGDTYIKYLLILTAIGLNPKDLNFDEFKSKQIILLIVGFIGGGKSNLMNRLQKYIQNFGDAGQTSSPVGLTGGSEKNASGQFIFRMGEISKCNNGVLFGDEIGMWNIEVLNAITQQMSEGKITYTKIIKFEQKLFLNYILCGNPPEGDFNPHKTQLENVGATPQINDRANAICIMREPIMSEKKLKDIFASTIGFNDEQKIIELRDDFVRDIIKRIKDDYPNPFITKEIFEYAQNKFMRLATKKPEDKEGFLEGRGIKRFHVRAWESFCRYIKAVGRIAGHKESTTEDVDFAWEILYYGSYVDLLRDYGDIDLSSFEMAEKKKLEIIRREGDRPLNKNQLILWIVKKLKRAENNQMSVMDIEQTLSGWNLDHLLEDSLNKLKNENMIREVGRDNIRLL